MTHVEFRRFIGWVNKYRNYSGLPTFLMGRHEKADQNFYITTNLVMNLASRVRELFESSEVTEKRQLLDLMFQNLQSKDASLSFTVSEPFLTMMEYKNRPGNWGWLDSSQASQCCASSRHFEPAGSAHSAFTSHPDRSQTIGFLHPHQ
jgi:hypothetical protein